MASRNLLDLSESVRLACFSLRLTLKEQGYGLLVYCTMRSDAEQDQLYALGRSKAGAIVTNAPAGKSFHNPDKFGKAWAFDAVPVLAGKALWNDDKAIDLMGKLGEEAGLQWAGRWRGSLKEKVHFQKERPTWANR